MREHKVKKIPTILLDALAASPVVEFADKAALDKQLKQLNITDERHVRIATEGALIGALLHKGDVETLLSSVMVLVNLLYFNMACVGFTPNVLFTHYCQ